MSEIMNYVDIATGQNKHTFHSWVAQAVMHASTDQEMLYSACLAWEAQVESRQVAEAPKQAQVPVQALQQCLCALNEASAGMPAAVGAKAEPVQAPAWLLSACLLELPSFQMPSLRAGDCLLHALEAPLPPWLSA